MAQPLEIIIKTGSGRNKAEVIKRLSPEAREKMSCILLGNIIRYSLNEPSKDCSENKRKRLERDLYSAGEVTLEKTYLSVTEKVDCANTGKKLNDYIDDEVTVLRIMPNKPAILAKENPPSTPQPCVPEQSPVRPAGYSLLKDKAKDALATAAILSVLGSGVYLCCREVANANTGLHNASNEYVSAPQIPPVEPPEAKYPPEKPKRQYVERKIEYDSSSPEIRARKKIWRGRVGKDHYSSREEEKKTISLDSYVIPASRLRQE